MGLGFFLAAGVPGLWDTNRMLRGGATQAKDRGPRPGRFSRAGKKAGSQTPGHPEAAGNRQELEGGGL